MRFVYRTASRVIPTLVVLLALIFVQFASNTALANRSMVLSPNNLGISNHLTNARKSTFPTTSSPCNPCGLGDLQYQNGSAVELHPKAYAIFWGANWKDSSGKLTQDGQIVQKYFSDVGGTNFENIVTQYYMQNSNNSQSFIQNTLQFDATHIWIDPTTPPNSLLCGVNTVEDSAIQTEVEASIKKNTWPQADPSATFFVYTPPNWAIRFPAPSLFWYKGCSNLIGAGFGGYHWMNPVTLTRYAPIVYPTQNYFVPQSPNGNIYGDSLANATSHEQFEAITDPRPYDGWADSNSPPAEIGDKCTRNFLAGTTRLKNSGIFELQEEYSDASHSCVNTFAPHLSVNTTADLVPPCTIAAYSLRCAITQVNNDGSRKPIWFNIPSSDSGCKLTTIQGKSVYVCTITPTSSITHLLASHITINGYTQPGAQKNKRTLGSGDNAILTIRIDGSEGAGGLVLDSSASYDTIQGLEITNFQPYGLLLNSSSNTNNSINGNFVGTDGINALGNGAGIYISSGASSNIVGGQSPDKANLVSGNSGQGIVIGAGSSNTVEGNNVGTNFNGNSGIANGIGIAIFAAANNNLIGGTTASSANIIAYNNYGITTNGSTNTNITGNTITSNFIGIQVYTGESGDSILKNVISMNTDAGILLGNSSTDNVHVSVMQNSIFNNGGLGIDLYPADVVNCSGPTSGGPNDYIPCPIISSATTTQISGTACYNCVVEVYIATNEADDQGHGEGKTFLGSVTADSNGNWTLSVTLSTGNFVTATATTNALDGISETSEFAANVTVA